MTSAQSGDVDIYVATAPEAARPKLRQLRRVIRGAAPTALEQTSYGMPFYELDGRLVYFAGYKSHVALYAAARAVATCAPELAPYLSSKATLRFPLDRPLPVAAIRTLVRFRVDENREKARRQSPRRVEPMQPATPLVGP
jgi:uncharacterized protein YdhG (YjbR/CyaY superfamily)